MEKKFPFSPISYHGGLEYAFFGQLIPGAQLNLHVGEAGVGFIAELSKITGWRFWDLAENR